MVQTYSNSPEIFVLSQLLTVSDGLQHEQNCFLLFHVKFLAFSPLTFDTG